MASQGYLYVAAGDQYLEEAQCSVASLRAVDPNAHVTLITNQPCSAAEFDTVIVQAEQLATWTDVLLFRSRALSCTPYERTLFLDTDTYFYEDCTPLFGLLDSFDLCAAASPGDSADPYGSAGSSELGGYNLGVVPFRTSQATLSLFHAWSEDHRKAVAQSGEQLCPSQPSFLRALMSSAARMHTLPPVWNARFKFFLSLKGSVKIAHGRGADFEMIRERINCSTRHRCWDPVRQLCLTKQSLRQQGASSYPDERQRSAGHHSRRSYSSVSTLRQSNAM